MKIECVSKEIYLERIPRFQTVFETPQFNELNSASCDEIDYLLGHSNKTKFGLIGGVKENTFMAPFSAPYYLFAIARDDIRLVEYDEFVNAVIVFFREKKMDGITFTLPPIFYSPSVISMIENCLLRAGFFISHLDLNYHYTLSKFSDFYLTDLIHHHARKNLKTALSHNLRFIKVMDNQNHLRQTAYDIIYVNRTKKGYPLKMSFDKIVSTTSIIKADWFLITDSKEYYIAAALCFYVAKNIIQVVYWGDLPDASHLRPMNFLAYKLFEYYKQAGLDYVDIGPSTDRGIPNFGLCDYKQSIGCDITPKTTFIKKLI